MIFIFTKVNVKKNTSVKTVKVLTLWLYSSNSLLWEIADLSLSNSTVEHSNNEQVPQLHVKFSYEKGLEFAMTFNI